MTSEIITEVTVPVRHVRIAIDTSFEDGRTTFESILLQLDARIAAWLQSGEVARTREALEHGPDLSIFQSRDHGRVLRLAGLARKAVQYDIGNPLTASTMTRHEIAAALYARFASSSTRTRQATRYSSTTGRRHCSDSLPTSGSRQPPAPSTPPSSA